MTLRDELMTVAGEWLAEADELRRARPGSPTARRLNESRAIALADCAGRLVRLANMDRLDEVLAEA